MNAQPALICIPDISGFTQFMSEIDFELGSKVIPSLLNEIIYSNQIGLKISEIEGDAVLFYKTGDLPPLFSIIEQCKNFYINFYERLNILRNKHNDFVGAARIPTLLGLKIILHYGNEIGLVPIGNRIKLIGEDIISAHRLLKNNLSIDEYIILSHNLTRQFEEDLTDKEFDWATLKESFIMADHIGKINFSYINLSPLVQ